MCSYYIKWYSPGIKQKVSLTYREKSSSSCLLLANIQVQAGLASCDFPLYVTTVNHLGPQKSDTSMLNYT